MIPLERPIGAHSDVRELEYISALMQSGAGVRLDGSITAADIVVYLRSRHGIKVNEATVQDLIFRQLAGSTVETDPPVLDLCQLVSLLLIPNIVEASHDKTLGSKMIEPLLTILQSYQKDPSEKLDRDVLRKVFALHDGFFDISDDVLDDMLAVADSSVLDALSSDLGGFDLTWKDQLTTNMEDALQVQKASNLDPENSSASILKETMDCPFQKIHTASFIDFCAETYRRPLYVVCLFACAIINYFAYVYATNDGSWADIECGAMSDVVCGIIQGLLTWLAIMIQLTVLGIIFIGFGSLGNRTYHKKSWLTACSLLISIVVIILTAIIPFFVGVKTKLFDTTGNKDNIEEDGEIEEYDKDEDVAGSFYVLSVTLGFVLLSFLIVDLGVVVIPREWLAKSSVVPDLITPASLRAESAQKKAASFKVSKMLENALSLHRSTDCLTASVNSTESKAAFHAQLYAHAISNFQAQESKTEKVGGIIWAWKRIWDGSISSEEGIWLHSRLIVGNFLQLLVFIIITFLAHLGFKNSNQFVYSENPTVAQQADVLFTGLVNETLNCTNMFFGNVGGSFVFPTWNAYAIWKWVQQDDAMDNSTSLFWQIYVNITGSVVIDCFEENPTENANILQINSLYECVNGLLSNETIKPIQEKYASQTDFLLSFSSPLDLFRLRWIVDGGYEEVNKYFHQCNATDELIQYINATNYDDVAENEGVLATVAETLQLTQTGYHLAISAGYIASAITILYLTLTYIPSFISSVIRFRSGVLPSLRENAITCYRPALDTVTVLFGAVFWGALFTTVAVGALFFCVVAILASQYGESVAALLLGPITGFFLIIIIKTVVLMFLRNLHFKNFYRKKPASANLFFLVMEVWNVALSFGYIVVRIIKILLISLFFVARFDEQLLAPGVGRVAGIELDGFWLCFRKDLLMHEAHRHPYIERLGLLCLLKLNHRERFGARPNACWRLLYVLVSMPWVKKYRVCSNPNTLSKKIGFAFAEPSEEINEHEELISHAVSTSNAVVNESQRITVEYSEESPHLGGEKASNEEHAEERAQNPNSSDVVEACSGLLNLERGESKDQLTKKPSGKIYF